MNADTKPPRTVWLRTSNVKRPAVPVVTSFMRLLIALLDAKSPLSGVTLHNESLPVASGHTVGNTARAIELSPLLSTSAVPPVGTCVTTHGAPHSATDLRVQVST